jgi:spermidine/putrescine transport system substrate-binding protein
MDFINFLNEPEHAAQLAQFVYYATPNREAEKRLPREFLEDPIIYPDRTVLAKSEFYSELPPRVQKRYNTVLPRIIE